MKLFSIKHVEQLCEQTMLDNVDHVEFYVDVYFYGADVMRSLETVDGVTVNCKFQGIVCI